MARKTIDIGVVGNDGTGDSIRDSFRKVNDNFRELYSSLGLETNLSFKGLIDGPGSYLGHENDFVTVNATETGLAYKRIEEGTGIKLQFTNDGAIIVNTLFASISGDQTPSLGGPVYAFFGGERYPIGGLPDLRSNTEWVDAVSKLGSVHGGSGSTATAGDRIAANKGYVDTKIARAGVDAINPATGVSAPEFGTMSGPLILSRDPIPSDDEVYNGQIAATKRYVDSSAFGSVANLYVATSGADERVGVSPELQGRALAYAYRTIEAAMKRAEEIMLESRVEIGPYKKVLTYNKGASECTLSSISASPDSGSGFVGTVFMSVDTIVLSATGRVGRYRVGDLVSLATGTGVPCQIEVLATDGNPGAIASFRVVTPGVYSSLPGGFNVPTINNTVGSVGVGAKFDVTYKVNSVLVTNGGVNYGLVSVRIAAGVGDITGSGAFGTADVSNGAIQSITITDQGSGFTALPVIVVDLPRFKIFTNGLRTDFTGNVIDNTALAARTRDIRDGLYLRGEESGALAQILAHNGTLDGFDEVFDVDIKYGAFKLGEVIAYGDVTKLTQITVLIESGTYEENYPLKVPQNVAIVGDEFRRVVIKPKVGTSSSPWAFQNFRRDLSIDGNTTASQLFGYHYLTDTTAPVYPLVANKGYYRSAAQLVFLNKTFLENEITAWIAYQVANNIAPFTSAFKYDANLFARDIGLIIDGYIFDLKWSGYNRTISIGLKYKGEPSAPLSQSIAAVNYVNTLVQQIIANTTIPTIYNNTKRQIIDRAYVAETGSATVITALKNAFIDVISNSGSVNYPKDNNNLDVFLCNDATIIRAVTCQGHGGFMMVLDPEGQILAKSPYAQESASFMRSTGVKRFSGGMYVDGFTGNLQFEIYDKGTTAPGNFKPGHSYTIKTVGNTNFTAVGAISNTVGVVFTATGAGAAGSTGLASDNSFIKVRGLKRFPNLPASYIVNDTVYRINYVRDWTYLTTGSTASFILDEVTPWNQAIFSYNADICSRDVGLIINGLGYDLAFGTNYNQRKSGLVYRQANAQVVIDTQLSLTIAAIGQAHTLASSYIPGATYSGTRSLIDLSNTNIANILRSGTVGAPILSFTNPSTTTTNQASAMTLLQANYEYIKEQTVNWIQNQIVNNTSPFSTSYTYDSATCARDVGYILEAVVYNFLYGGNDAVRDAGLKYYDGVGDAVTLQIPTAQKTASVAAINYASTITQRVIQNLAPTTSYTAAGAVGAGLISRTTGTGATATEATTISGLMNVVTTILSGGVGSAPTLSLPAVTGIYDATKTAARTIITGNVSAIQAGVIAYVNANANQYEVLMPGNRSMLANDYTQINDMGYGLVVNNGGLLEAVSVFTYYCYISYYSLNGGQIRSISGSSAHGVYALVAEGSDPLEIPTPVTLYQDLGTGALVISTGVYLNTVGGLNLYIYSYDFVPLDNGELEVIHTDGQLYRYSVTSVTTADLPAGYAKLNISSTGNSTTAGLAYAIPDGTRISIRALSQVVLTGDIVDVATRPSTALKLNETTNVYRVLQFQDYTDPAGAITCTISNGSPCVVTAVAHGQLAGYIVSFTSTGTLPTGITAGVKYYILDNGLTANQFKISLVKAGSPVITTSGSSGTISFTAKGLARTTLRENYDYVELTAWSPNEFRGTPITVTVASPATTPLFSTGSTLHGFVAGDVVAFATTGTLPTGVTITKNFFVIASGLTTTAFRVSVLPGGTAIDTTGTQTGVHTVGKVKGYVGDSSFAIVPLSPYDRPRIVGMKVVWLGRIYTVSQYDDESATGKAYGRIYFSTPLQDNVLTYSSPPTLKAGVAKRINASAGTLTIRISLTRVTGHDLLEIGTGSYADTNYPNEIYGGAVNALSDSNETQERGSGRAFYVTTDQFGNFRVGPYFRVDQGTGKVTFSAAIALSNLDGLGFKRGVPVSEFSTDSSMANNATDTVPTQNAVRTYIERRLGVSHTGVSMKATELIPPLTGGYMALTGQLSMNGNMDLGNNKIINVKNPTLPQDAVNLQSLKWTNFQDFTLSSTNVDSGDLVVFTGYGANSVNASVVGDITFEMQTGTDSSLNQVNAQIAPGAIVNADVNANAAIDQTKLNLDNAYTTGSSGITSVTASGSGNISFLAKIDNGSGGAGTTLTILTSDPSGTLINAGLSIQGPNVPANTYIVSNISGTGLNSTWLLNNSVLQPTTTLTASLITLTYSVQPTVPFVTGQRIIVSGMSISGYNGIKTVINASVTSVTFTGTTTGAGTGGTVSPLKGVASFDNIQFTATNGWITVRDNGLLLSKLQPIANKTVLGNNDIVTNNVTAVTFTTVVDQGGSVKKTQYSSTGILRRTNAGSGGYTSDSDYVMIEATSGATGYATGDADKLMVRNGTGDFGGRTLTIQDLKLKLSTDTTAVATLQRTTTATGGAHRLYNFNGSGGISLGSGTSGVSGTGLAADHTTFYDNDFHSFRKRDGNTAASITAGSIQVTTITSGGPTTDASIIGRWSLSGVGSRMQATYSADLAEYYEGDKTYEVGTVLVFGGDKEVTIATTKEDYRIAGVVSDTAAYSMYGACPGEKNLIALQGRVPVRVAGRIKKGDLLVTSHIAGVAVSVGGIAKTGTVIGKALEDHDSDHVGTIQVAVGRT